MSIFLTVVASLAAGGVMAQASQELLYKRDKIINSRYTSELKNAKTAAQKQAVIKRYSDQMYPNGNIDYGTLPPAQRVKLGSAGMSAATQDSDGSSSWAKSRKKLEREGAYGSTLNYYDVSGTVDGQTAPAMQLLPPQ